MLNGLALRVLVTIQGIGHAIESKLRDEDGQTLAEYGLIMAVIAVAVIVTAGFLFRNAIVNAFNGATDCLNNAPSSSTCS
ncbi:MAG TPA: Flp family type IVb pilin [Dehalococcoidia bacterium]|jgi:Flp pilus assembly pilin Flp|nr:Flp family type IVb pilin [Dehalococcoidia bacterium]